MSFRQNDHQQMHLNDRLNGLTDRERRFLEKSWAKPFAERIFPLINEAPFEVLFCTQNGRPNTPVNVIIGSLLLKEMSAITDEELVDSIMLDSRYQYALHLTSYEEIPYSDRTPSRFRERLYKHELETGEDLLKDEMERLGKEFAKLRKISGALKRTDSLMVSSSCKNMGRLELMYTCVSNLVKAMVKRNSGVCLPDRLLEYAKDGNANAVCYRMEAGEVKTRQETVAADAILLQELCAEDYRRFEEYRLLLRMLGDQTKEGRLKSNQEIRPDSLQNPSDPDATYRRKGGKGYQGYTANIVEDCGEDGTIITSYDFDVNLRTDIDFGACVIETLGQQEEPIVILSDGGYASDANFEAAESNNIELVTTNLLGQKPPEILAEFRVEDRVLLSCPAGHFPTDCKYNEEKGQYRAHFDKETCENCPHRAECPVVFQKKTALVRVSQTTLNRANYFKKLSSEVYKNHAKKRNGVEGIPSVLRRAYEVDRMPVRGLLRAKMWFGFKIGAINCKRMVAAASFLSSFVSVWENRCFLKVLFVYP